MDVADQLAECTAGGLCTSQWCWCPRVRTRWIEVGHLCPDVYQRLGPPFASCHCLGNSRPHHVQHGYHIVLSTLFATADRPWSEDTCVPGALNLLTVPTYSLRCLLVIGLITIWPKSNTLTRLRSQHCSRSTLHIVVEPLQHLFGQASYVYSV